MKAIAKRSALQCYNFMITPINLPFFTGCKNGLWFILEVTYRQMIQDACIINGIEHHSLLVSINHSYLSFIIVIFLSIISVKHLRTRGVINHPHTIISYTCWELQSTIKSFLQCRYIFRGQIQIVWFLTSM